MRRSLFKTVGLALGVILILPALLDPGLLKAPITLMVGWWPSFARLFKAWHPNPNAVVLFTLAATVLVVGSHAFLKWLYLYLRSAQERTSRPNWPWKWTLCGFGMLFCTLLAICSIILTTHQLYWISKSSDPLFTDPIRERVGMLKAAMTLQKSAEEVQWDTLRTRAAFWTGNSIISGQPASEALQAVWIEQDEHRLRAIILIPRRPMHRTRAKFIVVQPGINMVTRRLDELLQVLSSFGIGDDAGSSKGKPTLLP